MFFETPHAFFVIFGLLFLGIGCGGLLQQWDMKKYEYNYNQELFKKRDEDERIMSYYRYVTLKIKYNLIMIKITFIIGALFAAGEVSYLFYLLFVYCIKNFS